MQRGGGRWAEAWADQAEADEQLMRSLPRRPGERRVAEATATGAGALRFSADFRSKLETASRKPDSGARGRGARGRAVSRRREGHEGLHACAPCAARFFGALTAPRAAAWRAAGGKQSAAQSWPQDMTQVRAHRRRLRCEPPLPLV
jgi:hypothetical protein